MSRLKALLWGVPMLIMINDSLFSIAMAKDDGMHPTIQPGDLVIVDKLTTRHLQSGQVVLMRNPEANRGATDLQLIRRVDFHPETRFSKYQYVKDNRGSDARDSQDFGPVPDAVILGKVVAVVFPPWRAQWLGQGSLWRVSDT